MIGQARRVSTLDFGTACFAGGSKADRTLAQIKSIYRAPKASCFKLGGSNKYSNESFED